MESGDLMMDLDLNEEPEENSLGLLLIEIDGYHARIEERIRQLEAVTARARERYSLRHNSVASLLESNLNSQSSSGVERENGVNCVIAGRGGGSASASGVEVDFQFQGEKFSQGDGVNLIAKALALDSPDEKKSSKGEGGYFDCNICFDLARDPILTCCGHLFCWPCFCKLPFVSSNSPVRECPACMGEVGDDNITPIYGNGSSESSERKEPEDSGFKIPPRPHAQRVESTRQSRAPRFRQIRNRYRLNLQASSETGTSLSGLASATPDIETDAARPMRLSAMRLLSGFPSPGRIGHASAARASASASASSMFERYGDNMDFYDNREQMMMIESLLTDDRDELSDLAAVVLDDTTTQGQETAPRTSLFGMQNDDASATVAELESRSAIMHDDGFRTSTPAHISSSSRRRTGSENGAASHAPRRRRLRE